MGEISAARFLNLVNSLPLFGMTCSTSTRLLVEKVTFLWQLSQDVGWNLTFLKIFLCTMSVLSQTDVEYNKSQSTLFSPHQPSFFKLWLKKGPCYLSIPGNSLPRITLTSWSNQHSVQTGMQKTWQLSAYPASPPSVYITKQQPVRQLKHKNAFIGWLQHNQNFKDRKDIDDWAT